jgi:adenylate cyclase
MAYPGPSAEGVGPDVKDLLRWLQGALDVLQNAASSDEFFNQAALALRDLVRFDTGRVLLLEKGEWHTLALKPDRYDASGTARPPSQHVLGQLRAQKKTFWEQPGVGVDVALSLHHVAAVVAAPILNRDGEVIGALYGDRLRWGVWRDAPPVTELDAMLVQLLAREVAARLARLEQEQAALAARVQFEQFFTPELARQLERHPDLLEGREADVSVLFCDVQGFSGVSERLGPAGTVRWIGDVMQALSECVLAHDGVLVDYIGDELMAMWGAPEEQPDHARLACRAALDMLRRLPELNERWRGELGEPMALGIGISTGPAQVGNTGSRHKFKYGPLGNTVNLASRVQTATRHFRRPLLITEATRAELGDAFAARRLCQARVRNITRPVGLYELVPEGEPDWPAAREEYARALGEFERGQFTTAAHTLAAWLARRPDDWPALLLLHRAVECMVSEPAPSDPVWDVLGK